MPLITLPNEIATRALQEPDPPGVTSVRSYALAWPNSAGYTIDFSASDKTWPFFAQSAWVDNSGANGPLVMSQDIGSTPWQIILAAGEARMITLPAVVPLILEVASSATQGATNLHICNHPAPTSDSGLALVAGSGNVVHPPHEPDIFASASCTALSTTLYTPPAGKRFRLLSFILGGTGFIAAASAGLQTLALLDGGAATGLSFSVWVQTAGSGIQLAPASQFDLGEIGYLSNAVGNALTVTLSEALTEGAFNVTAMLSIE